MAQFYRVEYTQQDNPEENWVKTLSRHDVLHLIDSQGTPIFLPQCLKWWAVEPHITGNEFKAEYGPDPQADEPQRSFEAEAL